MRADLCATARSRAIQNGWRSRRFFRGGFSMRLIFAIRTDSIMARPNGDYSPNDQQLMRRITLSEHFLLGGNAPEFLVNSRAPKNGHCEASECFEECR
jgi:hypothetical protein